MMAIDLLIGVFHARAHGLMLDEAFSYSYATASWPDFLQALHRFDGPLVVWYGLLRLWFAVFPPTLFFGRLLTVLFGVATLPTIYSLGREMFNRNVGVVAALLLLLNTSWWSREETVRMYALAILLSTCSYLAFLVATRNQKTRDTFFASALNVSLCGLQLIIGFNQFVGQLASCFARTVSKRSAVVILGTTAMSIVVFGYVFSHLGQNNASWIPYMRPDKESAKVIAGSITASIGTPVVMLALAAASFAALRYNFNSNTKTLLTWIIAPVILTVAISIVKPIIGERYFLGCLAPTLILAAVGITSLRPKWSLALLAVALGAEVYSLNRDERAPHQDWAEATSIILRSARSNDVVAVYSRTNVVGLIAELKLENTQLAPGVKLYPDHATEQWDSNDLTDRVFPKAYLTGRNSVYVVLSGNKIGHKLIRPVWPTDAYDDLIRTYHKCSETSDAIQILRYAKNCAGNYGLGTSST